MSVFTSNSGEMAIELFFLYADYELNFSSLYKMTLLKS